MIVVDTNVLVYSVLPGEFEALAARVRKRDHDWRGPALIEHELVNVLSSYCRREKLDRDAALRVYKQARSMLRGELVPLRAPSVLNLSVASRCTTYDCSFIDAAQQLGARLVTTDAQLLNAFPGVTASIRDFAEGR